TVSRGVLRSREPRHPETKSRSELTSLNGESVAAAQAVLIPTGEPSLSLVTGPMCPGLGVDEPGLLLNVVVTDGHGGVERIGQLRFRRRLEVVSPVRVSQICRSSQPCARVAVCLQFDSNPVALWSGSVVRVGIHDAGD